MKSTSTLQLFVAAGAVLLVGPSTAKASDGELEQALRHFLYQPNYSWSASTTVGVPESGDQLATTSLDGQHEVGGFTKVWGQGWWSPGVRAVITDEDDHYTAFLERLAVETDRGWISWKEMRFPIEVREAYRVIGIDDPPLQEVSVPGPEGTDPTVITRARVDNVGLTGPIEAASGFWRPDQEVAVFVENIASLTSPSSGVYQVELTSDGVESLVNPIKPEIVRRIGREWRIDNATVKLIIHVRERVMVSYSFSVAGTWVFGPHRKGLNLRMNRTLTNLGTTQIQVPQNIEELLRK